MEGTLFVSFYVAHFYCVNPKLWYTTVTLRFYPTEYSEHLKRSNRTNYSNQLQFNTLLVSSCLFSKRKEKPFMVGRKLMCTT